MTFDRKNEIFICGLQLTQHIELLQINQNGEQYGTNWGWKASNTRQCGSKPNFRDDPINCGYPKPFCIKILSHMFIF